MITGIICSVFFSCDDYSVSEKQAESFLKYFPVSIEDNMGNEVIQTLNGGYVILSNFSNQGVPSSDRDIPVILCDEFGRQGSNSPIMVGTNGVDQGKSLISVNDGYIIAGSSLYADRKEGLLIKLGTGGQVIWQKNYSGFQEMEFRDVTSSLDGGFIITGYVKNSTEEQKVILFKTSSGGDSLWMREIGFVGFNDIGESVIEHQGRILVAGTTSAEGSSGFSKLLILNTNLDGRGYTEVRIVGNQDLSGKRIIRTNSGVLYVLGNEENKLSGVFRIYLARLQLTGAGNEIVTINASAYLDDQGSVYAYDLKPTIDNSLAICGWQFLQNDYNVFFTQVSENLQIISSQTFGAKGYQSAYGIYITSDEGFALAGAVDLGGGRTSMLLKLDNNGELK